MRWAAAAVIASFILMLFRFSMLVSFVIERRRISMRFVLISGNPLRVFATPQHLTQVSKRGVDDGIFVSRVVSCAQ